MTFYLRYYNLLLIYNSIMIDKNAVKKKKDFKISFPLPPRAPSSSSLTTETGSTYQPAPCWRTKSYLATYASWITDSFTRSHPHVTYFTLSQSCDLNVSFPCIVKSVSFRSSTLLRSCNCCSRPLGAPVAGAHCPLQVAHSMTNSNVY